MRLIKVSEIKVLKEIQSCSDLKRIIDKGEGWARNNWSVFGNEKGPTHGHSRARSGRLINVNVN